MKITTRQIINVKRPQLKAEILKVLNDRFSPRIFSDEKIEKKHILSLFEAVRWSPSYFNAQPWIFYYAKSGTPGFEKISSSMTEENNWAKKTSLLILGCYIDVTVHGKNPYAMYDLGQAVFSLVIQAQSLGYYCHQMAGFDKNKIRQNIGIKEPIVPHVLITIGKIGDYTKVDSILVEKDNFERKRKENVAVEI